MHNPLLFTRQFSVELTHQKLSPPLKSDGNVNNSLVFVYFYRLFFSLLLAQNRWPLNGLDWGSSFNLIDKRLESSLGQHWLLILLCWNEGQTGQGSDSLSPLEAQSGMTRQAAKFFQNCHFVTFCPSTFNSAICHFGRVLLIYFIAKLLLFMLSLANWPVAIALYSAKKWIFCKMPPPEKVNKIICFALQQNEWPISFSWKVRDIDFKQNRLRHFFFFTFVNIFCGYQSISTFFISDFSINIHKHSHLHHILFIA